MKSKSIELFKTGGFDSFRLIEKEISEPGPNQIRIQIHAAGVAYADVMMRHGKSPGSSKIPITPGYDVFGIVEAVGKNAADFSPGDSVAALTQTGGYAQHICVDSYRAVVMPKGSDPFVSTCLPLNYTTAYQMLHNVAKVQRGSKILVHSAAGGVGTALLQLGSLLDLKMYGTASAGKHGIVSENNGIPIDYKKDDFVKWILARETEKIDAAFDPVGGKNWLRSRQLIKKGGKIIGFGALSMYDNDTPVNGLISTLSNSLRLKLFKGGRSFHFYGINVKKNPGQFNSDFRSVVSLYTEGKLKPVVGNIFPLSEVGEAHRLLTSGKATGKLVLDCRG